MPMSIPMQVMMVIASALWGWCAYLSPLFKYSRNLSWYPYMIAAGWISMLLLFLEIVRQGEEGYLKFVAWDLGRFCKEGAYWPLNLFPFAKGIHIAIGFTIVVRRFSTLGSTAGSPSIYHYSDQRISSLQLRANTDSLGKAILFHNLNRLGNALFSFRDEEGRWKYYKMGSYLYITCWIFAFFGNIGNHASQAANYISNQTVQTVGAAVDSFAQSYTPPGSGAREIFTKVDIELDTGVHPPMPNSYQFSPMRQYDERERRFSIRGVTYLKYFEPDPNYVDLMEMEKSLCGAIPVGRKIHFSSKTPPIFAANMDDQVMFLEKRFGFSLPWNFLDEYLLEVKEEDWEYVRKNWSKIETSRYGMEAEAKMAYELPAPAGGGFVCF